MKTAPTQQSKRKTLRALLVGGVVGIAMGLSSSKANAVITLTPLDLFEMFVDKVGGILVAFFLNRFYSSWMKQIDTFKEKIKKVIGDDSVRKSKAETQASEKKVEEWVEDQRREMAKDAEVSCLYVNDGKRSEAIYDSTIQSIDNRKSITDTLTTMNATPIMEQTASINDTEAFKIISAPHIDSENKLKLVELPKILEETHIDDEDLAFRELALLTTDCASKNSLSRKPDIEEIKAACRQASISTAIDSIAHLISRRIGSTTLKNQISTTIPASQLGTLTLASKVSPAEAISAEVEYYALSPAAISEGNQFAAATPVLTLVAKQMALKTKVESETRTINELISNIDSMVFTSLSEYNQLLRKIS